MADEQQTKPWAAPRPATDDELRTHLLPCDVRVGGDIVFRKGVPLHTLVALTRRLHGHVYEGKDIL